MIRQFTRFNIIVACDKNGLIGLSSNLKNDIIPWHIKEDFKYFKNITKDSYIIIGRKTYESILNNYTRKNKPVLPNRHKVIISRNLNYNVNDNNTIVTNSFQSALDATLCKDKPVWVIGGSNIYKKAIKHLHLDEIHLTKINKDYLLEYSNDITSDYDNITKTSYFPLNKLNKYVEQNRFEEINRYKLSDDSTNPSNNNSNNDSCNIEYDRIIYKTTNLNDHNYLNLCHHVYDDGQYVEDRTGVGCKYIMGTMAKYDALNFPLLESKKVFARTAFNEIMWMLKGQTDVNDFKGKIWDKYTSREHLNNTNKSKYYPKNILGPGYGWQFRYCGLKHPVTIWIEYCENNKLDFTDNNCKWDEQLLYNEYKKFEKNYMDTNPDIINKNYVDQLQQVIDQLSNNKTGRYAMINLWNPNELDNMALPPCHFVYHFYRSVNKNGYDFIDLVVDQRSGDLMLGVPFNIINACYILHIVSHLVSVQDKSNDNSMCIPRFLTHNIHHTHIYKNHLKLTPNQIDNKFLLTNFTNNVSDISNKDRIIKKRPQVILEGLSEVKSLDDLDKIKLKIKNYNPLANIKFKLN